jgi:hypothetical protein
MSPRWRYRLLARAPFLRRRVAMTVDTCAGPSAIAATIGLLNCDLQLHTADNLLPVIVCGPGRALPCITLPGFFVAHPLPTGRVDG